MLASLLLSSQDTRVVSLSLRQHHLTWFFLFCFLAQSARSVVTDLSDEKFLFKSLNSFVLSPIAEDVQARMEDCDALTPHHNKYLNLNETPRGTEFVQLDFETVKVGQSSSLSSPSNCSGGDGGSSVASSSHDSISHHHSGEMVNVTLSPAQAKMEDCRVNTPKGNFVQNQETPTGTAFAQLDTDSAINTGGIMRDLQEFENDWEGQLDSKVTAAAETPRQNNLERFKKASRNTLYAPQHHALYEFHAKTPRPSNSAYFSSSSSSSSGGNNSKGNNSTSTSNTKKSNDSISSSSKHSSRSKRLSALRKTKRRSLSLSSLKDC